MLMKRIMFAIIFIPLAVVIGGACALVAQVVGYPITIVMLLFGVSLEGATGTVAVLGFLFGLTGAWSITMPLWERVTEDW
ncbi:MAG TPA: hypothetical protein VJB41_02630 [Patescibacteria group bacterium]|nr:hypothetical protein [Patescibacteria group bacterium]